MATATARRRQLTLMPPSEVTVRDNNRMTVSASRLGRMAVLIELQVDEAEDRGDAEALCDACAAQSPRCAEIGCARRIIEWLKGAE